MESVATGKDVILDIVENMRQNREELLYSTLVPTRFEVYLHPEDHDRLHGIFPAILDEATRALEDAVEDMNKAARPVRGWKRLFGREQAPSQMAHDGWRISLHRDTDEELQQGEIMVVSSLSLPVRPEYGAGTRTRRMATSRVGAETKKRSQEIDEQEPGAARAQAVATLTYEDSAGRHTYRVEKPVTVIGRGGIGYWVDVKLEAPPDVSREHARLRRGEDGRFYIKDLSTFGTTVNGTAIESSVETVGEEKRDRNIEVPLPQLARIGLASAIYLDFKVEAAGATRDAGLARPAQ
jgi:hypothetical protein